MTHQLLEIVAAIVITVILGLGVGNLIESVIPRPNRPKPIKEEVWKAMDKRVYTGKWIGFFERLVSLMSFWIPAYAIIGGWLAFKVAAKWEVWKNIIRVPDSLEGIPQLAWYQARVAYGSWLHSRFLLGTLLNVLIGAISAYLGQHVWQFLGWLGS